MNLQTKQTAVFGLIWSGLQNVGAQLSAFIVFLVLARLLAPEDFGLAAMAIATISFFAIFSGSSLSSALVQREEIEAIHLNSMFWLLLGIAVSLTGIAFVSSGAIATFLGDTRLEPLLKCLCICLTLNALQDIQISLLRRELQFKALALRSLVAEPLSGAIGIVVALLDYGVWALVAKTLTAAIFQVIVLWWKCPWRPNLQFSYSRIKELIIFGSNVMGANILAFGGKQMDALLIGHALGAGPLGYYNVAKRLVILLAELIGGTIESVAWPMFSRMQREKDKVVAAFYKASFYAALIACPMFLGMAILADQIIPTLFGEKWTESADLMRLLAVIGFVQVLVRLHEALLVGLGRPQLKLRLQFCLAIANLIAFFLTVDLGLAAVAMGFATVNICLLPLWLLAVARVIPISYVDGFSSYMVPIAAGAVMTVSLLIAIQHVDQTMNSYAALVLYVLIGGLAYVASSILLSRDVRAELNRAIGKLPFIGR